MQKNLSLIVISILSIIIIVGSIVTNKSQSKALVNYRKEISNSHKYLMMHIENSPGIPLTDQKFFDVEGKEVKVVDFIDGTKRDAIFYRVNRNSCETCLEVLIKEVKRRRLENFFYIVLTDTIAKNIKLASRLYKDEFIVLGMKTGAISPRMDELNYSYVFRVDKLNNEVRDVFFPLYTRPQEIKEYFDLGALDHL